ncbi:metallophosphoesterase family protein [Corallococcus carmarthensis]|uniref:metallophosphoesterase family protein n=1 Tax=Corallococcus carmarthensis TaxID=2316728 RepID=UPI00148B3F12|nr:metallophosphoesterase [Corallococcus carmarthensis]NOK17401.1 metallophosphoesterase [Corallococcus carmarthensis]
MEFETKLAVGSPTMGFHFRFEHVNLVAYLTTATAEAPTATSGDLHEFVGALAQSDPRTFFVSRDRQWLSRMQVAAGFALEQLPFGRRDDVAPLESGVVSRVLQPLRDELSSFELYGFVVPSGGGRRGNGRKDSMLMSSMGFLATASHANALVLFPEFVSALPPMADDNVSPAFAAVADHANGEPGVVFWTQRGTTVFVREDCADDVVKELLRCLESGRPSELDVILRRFDKNPSRRVLHLSDLHFGTPEAARNLGLLQAEMANVVGAVDRVVITGDLFDSPDPMAAAGFRSFSQYIERLSGVAPVVVPGNHDQRIAGVVGQSFEQISKIPYNPVVVDASARMLIISLNSSIRGVLARGRVTQEQLVAVGSEIMNRHSVSPETRGYLRVVLVHHHPFSFGTEPVTLIQRALSKIGVGDEALLLLEDAEEFLEWCARWQVSVVLHGHKHQARYVSRTIRPKGAPSHLVTSIGCGTSLGAEGFPVSYNVVHWDERGRRWMVNFFESYGGGPFLPKMVGLSRHVGEAFDSVV